MPKSGNKIAQSNEPDDLELTGGDDEHCRCCHCGSGQDVNSTNKFPLHSIHLISID